MNKVVESRVEAKRLMIWVGQPSNCEGVNVGTSRRVDNVIEWLNTSPTTAFGNALGYCGSGIHVNNLDLYGLNFE